MKVISFFAGGECFAADASTVSKVARNIALTPLPAAPDEIAGIAGIKGKVVTLFDLDALRGTKAAPFQPGHKVSAVMFRPTADAPDEMGVVIDKPGEMLELDPERLAKPRHEREGAFIVGHYDINGTLYSIIDTNRFISRFKDSAGQNAGHAAEEC